MAIEWVFDPASPSGARSGGSAAEFGFKGQIDRVQPPFRKGRILHNGAERMGQGMAYYTVDVCFSIYGHG